MAEINEENSGNGVFGGIEFGGVEYNSVGSNGTTGTTQEQNGNMDGYVEIEGLEGTQPVQECSSSTVFTKVEPSNLPTKPSVWSKVKSFLFKEIDLTAPIKVELTPYQQKVEDEINEFLHQEISLKGFFNIFKKNK